MRSFRYLVSALFLFVGTSQIYAAGTAAGTSITNQATVGFSVGGVAQTSVNSNTVSFVVDEKVAFAVTSNGNLNVVPNATQQVLSYTVTHTGNYPADFSVAGINATGDNFDPSSYSVFVETNGTPGYQAGDTATFIDELAADASIVVYIVSTIPSTPINGDISTLHLQATARAGGAATTQGAVLTQNTGVDVAGSIDIVFADAIGSATGDIVRDGKHSASGNYVVVTATIAVVKSSFVVWDPVNCTGSAATIIASTTTKDASCGANEPKRIPGAVVHYRIAVSNTGGASATSLVISDLLNTNTLYLPGSFFIDAVAEDDDSTGADESDPNGANYTGTTATGSIGSIAASSTKNMDFRVTVK